MKKTSFLAILLFLISLAYAYSQSGQLGCCTNPGAGLLSCSSDRLASLNQECCPQPESGFTSYYKSEQNPYNPANYAECASSFFYVDRGCSGIEACAIGCCCSEIGGSVKPESQCKGTGLKFHKGFTSCTDVCLTPQCSDAIDNDHNGCADFDKDTGCTGPADNTESGGTCLSEGASCNNPAYEPKLSNFEISAAKGQKKFLLSWQDECRTNLLYYEIYRCQGVGCTNFELISTLNKNSFEDTSENLQYGVIYTFKIKAYYTLQSATPFAIKTGSLGSLECLNQLTSNVFCFNNSAYYCNALNNLVPQGTRCSQSELCIVTNNKPSCFPKSKCEEKKGNPLGLYYTKDGCEKNKWLATDQESYKYCFYDRSPTTVDNCFNCNPSMSCYDYKTEQACKSDNCRIGSGNCEWKQLSAQLEIGACVKKDAYNCEWCEKKGTASLENLRSYNEIFDRCTKEKSNALSTENFKCYFNNDKSTSCESMLCTNYAADQCSASDIKHDRFNNIINPSDDQCGLKVCQNINNACVKNADGDGSADCSSTECEADYYTPRTIAVAIGKKGAVDSISIQVYDKTSFNSSYALIVGQNYTTYLCLEPCNSDGHPYDIYTKSRHLIVSNLNVFDGNNGSRLLSPKEGANTILYYSQDPSKNIELVKALSFEAHANTSGPRIFSFNVTSGNKVNEKIYTSNIQPTIYVKFLEPAVVTFARLVNRNTSAIFNLQANSELSAEKELSIGQNLPAGEYRFELNAKNKNNIFMDTLFIATVVVDSTAPHLNITPSNGTVVNKSLVAARLAFNEEVRLNSVLINSQEIKQSFNTVNNKIFIAEINLSDGNKILRVDASDFAANNIVGTSSFTVDADPIDIRLSNPKFGVSPAYSFNIIIETDNNADCRYELDNELEFNFMNRFSSTTGTIHTIQNFNRIQNNATHKLYVKCASARHGIQSKSFEISVDTTKPQIKAAFAYPNPIIEQPLNTTLTVETDEPALCKFSASSLNFDSMEGKFLGFDESTFKTINRQPLNPNNQGSYSYFVACKNKAGLNSDTNTINFTADLSKTIIILSHTPQFFNSSTITLAIETNKKAQCKYSETDQTAQSGALFGQPGYSHTKGLVLPVGSYTFYIMCKDQYLEQWSNVFKVNFTIDTTAPVMLYVNDTSTDNLPPEKTCNTDRLRVKYLGQDLESGVKEYFYTILKGSQPIKNETSSNSPGEWTWVENLALQNNTQYFFSLRAKNYVNLLGENKISDGILVDAAYCLPVAICGDSLINRAGEECDGNTFGSINNCLNYTNFNGGILRCTPPNSANPCKLDTSNCTRIPDCNNGRLDPGEACDGNLFGIIDSCSKFNASFSGGTLKCTSKCELDTFSCTEKPKCGNNAIDQGESCDTLNFGPLTGKCIDYASTFTDGNLICTGCKLDTSKCQGVQGSCNNGIINIGEACDGNTFGQITSCTNFSNFIGGTLRCTSACQLDTSLCTEKPKCGNNAIDQGESCDNMTFVPNSGKCIDYSVDFNDGNLKCSDRCKLDTSDCKKAPLCGNTRIDAEEECDTKNFGALSGKCIDYASTFTDGNLICTGCKLDTSKCQGVQGSCNNGIINIGEQCDGNSFGTISSCLNYSDYAGGTLKCASNCTLDISGCTKAPTCGNKKLDTGELCDGSIFAMANLNCSNYKSTFYDGNLTCRNCEISTDSCSSNATIAPTITCRDRGTCKINEFCSDSSDCESRFCYQSKCTAPSCSDNVKNQEEADVDCGGPCSEKCNNDKSCRFNSDCRTGFCSLGKCGNAEICYDGKLSAGEADTDCGGPCPVKCPEGRSCIFDDDCAGELQCVSSQCKKIEIQTKDSDGDGLPDEWEIQNGLNPNDPSDSGQDPDNDGLTNKEEYEIQNTYAASTDPNNADTDNDGYSDKEELEKGTDPTNPEDFPKSNLMRIILFIAGALILLGGFGYLAYMAVERKKESEFMASRQMPRAAIPQQRQFPRQQFMPRPVQRAGTVPNLRAIEEQKALERKRMFEPFGKEKTGEKIKKSEEARTEISKEKEAKEKPKGPSKKPRKAPKAPIKKPKEDVFQKLKAMAQEAKTKKKLGKKNVPK